MSTTRNLTKWLVGIEESNVRLGHSPTLRNESIVTVSRGIKSAEQAMSKAMRRYAKECKTNEIALKVVSVVKVKGTEAKVFLDVYGELTRAAEAKAAKEQRLSTTQPIEQVIYDSAKVVDIDPAFSVTPAPKIVASSEGFIPEPVKPTTMTFGSMTIKLRTA